MRLCDLYSSYSSFVPLCREWFGWDLLPSCMLQICGKRWLEWIIHSFYLLKRAFVLTVFQLEDDVIAKAGYYNDMKTFSTQEASKQWLYLEFSQLGFIGMCVCVCV